MGQITPFIRFRPQQSGLRSQLWYDEQKLFWTYQSRWGQSTGQSHKGWLVLFDFWKCWKGNGFGTNSFQIDQIARTFGQYREWEFDKSWFGYCERRWWVFACHRKLCRTTSRNLNRIYLSKPKPNSKLPKPNSISKLSKPNLSKPNTHPNHFYPNSADSNKLRVFNLSSSNWELETSSKGLDLERIPNHSRGPSFVKHCKELAKLGYESVNIRLHMGRQQLPNNWPFSIISQRTIRRWYHTVFCGW